MNDKSKDIINTIMEISKMSTKDNSVIYDIKINDDSINYSISMLNQSGSKKTLEKGTIESKAKFFDFINPLIEQFSKKNKIILNDFVDINEDNLVTMRLVTETNDQLSIDGLKFEDVTYIKDLISNNKYLNQDKKEDIEILEDEHGMVYIWALFTILVLIGFAICCCTYFI